MSGDLTGLCLYILLHVYLQSIHLSLVGTRSVFNLSKFFSFISSPPPPHAQQNSLSHTQFFASNNFLEKGTKQPSYLLKQNLGTVLN